MTTIDSESKVRIEQIQQTPFEQQLFKATPSYSYDDGHDWIDSYRSVARNSAERDIRSAIRMKARAYDFDSESMRPLTAEELAVTEKRTADNLTGSLWSMMYTVGTTLGYGDQIPERWKTRERERVGMPNPLLDLKMAINESRGDLSRTLNQETIDALLNIPNSTISVVLADTVHLTDSQLAWVLYSPWLEGKKKEELVAKVKERQRKFGVTDEDYEKASESARKMDEAAKRSSDIPDEVKALALNPKQLELNALMYASSDTEEIIHLLSEVLPPRKSRTK